MKTIFISYKRKDESFARKLKVYLESWGYQTWIDVVNIRANENWDTSIHQGLQKSDAVIGILTPESVKSSEVQNEWAFALSTEKPLILVELETVDLVDIPHRYIRHQRIFFTFGYETALDQLKDALKQIAGITTTKLSQQTGLPSQISKRVLIIEDSDDYRMLLAERCEEFTKSIDTASSRTEASEQIRKNKYDLIFLDMQLSPTDVHGEGGKMLLDIWKRYQPETPLVIISKLPWNKNETRDFFRKYGVHDVLDKPIDHQSLTNILVEQIG